MDLKDSVVNLARYYVTLWVNTGDRALDGHLITATNILISIIITTTFSMWIDKLKQWFYTAWEYVRSIVYRKRTGEITLTTEKTQFSTEEFERYGKELKEHIKHKISWSISDELRDKLSNYIFNTISPHVGKNTVVIKNLQTDGEMSINQNLLEVVGEENMHPIYVCSEGIIGIGRFSRGLYLSCTSLKAYKCFLKYFHSLQHFVRNGDTRILYEWVQNRRTGDLTTRIATIYPDRNFDNYVSEHKERIIRHVDSVLKSNKTSHLNGFGSYNLGILLYGKPGTGKTSLIKALCNYTGRNGLLVYPKNLKSTQDFRALFEENRFERYVYIIEEIDLIAGVLSREIKPDQTEKDRKEEKEETKQQQLRKELSDIMESLGSGGLDVTMLTHLQNRVNEINTELENFKNSLCLSTILTELDGMNEMRGRILIATTNYPDRIDPALLRPGRFDLQINLCEYTDKEICELLSLIYKGSDLSCLQGKKFISGKYTPVEIINMCREHSMEEVVNYLCFETYTQRE